MVQFADVDRKDCMWGERDSSLRKAEIAQFIGRKRDCLLSIRKVAIMNPSLSEQERDLLLLAYSTEINDCRTARDALRERELNAAGEDASKEPFRDYHLYTINQYREKIDRELIALCEEGINFVKGRLLKHASDQDSRVAYLKFCADSARYAGDAAGKGKKMLFCVEAKESYLQALKLLDDENVESCASLRLHMVLNYALTLKELADDINGAIDFAGEAFRKAVQEMFLIRTEEAYQDSLVALGLLRDAVQMWCGESGNRDASEVFGIAPVEEAISDDPAEKLESIISIYEGRQSQDFGPSVQALKSQEEESRPPPSSSSRPPDGAESEAPSIGRKKKKTKGRKKVPKK